MFITQKNRKIYHEIKVYNTDKNKPNNGIKHKHNHNHESTQN